MKKKTRCRELVIPLRGNRTFLAMKYLLIFLFAFHLNGFSGIKAQQVAEYRVENANLKTCIKKVEQLTGKGFLYNGNDLERVGNVSLHLKNVSLGDLLTSILQGSGYTYELVNDVIAIVRVKGESRQTVEQELLKGIVQDTRGNVLPGVTVLIKGTTSGVVTDTAGRFTLPVMNRKSVVLVFSFVGMKSQEVAVNDVRKEVRVVMEEKVDELEEVVITGYGTTTKRRAAGSVAVLGREDLENRIPTSVDNLLQGLVAGVAVTASSGRPGSSAKIRIRGTNTITGNAEPLWVIDGVPVQDELPEISLDQVKSENFNEIFVNGIAGINPNDIENITFLKDAAAAAIYGSRAAGGVIVVTTKQGTPGKMRMNYSAHFGLGLKPQRDAGLMNASEKLAWEQELWDEFAAERYASDAAHYPVVGIVGMLRSNKFGRNGTLWTDEDFEPMTASEQDAYIRDLASHSTDWFDVIFRNSFDMTHNFSFSGGGNMLAYYASVGYAHQDGLLKEDSYDRYTVNLKINASPSTRVKMGMGLRVSNLVSDGPSMNVDPFKYAYFANPYERPYNEDGSFRPDMTYFNLTSINEGTKTPENQPTAGFNILREMEETSSEGKKFSVSGQFSLDVEILKTLTFSGLASYGYTNNREESILGRESYAAFEDRLSFDKNNNTQNLYGSISQSTTDGEQYNVRGHFSYTNTFEDHYLNVLAGAELRGSKSKRVAVKRYGYDEKTGLASMPEPPEDDNTYGSSWYTSLIDGLSGMSRSENKYASFYASTEYAYLGRYILNASFRTDGSNNFGSKEQFNPTWSLGFAWHVDDENFMQSLHPVLSRLTLRVATGFTGNVVQGTLKELVIKYNTSRYWNNLIMGSINKAPNPHLRWEKTRDMKVALDFGLFDDRVTGLVEGYWRKSTDVISRVRVVSSTGYNAQSYNASDIENKGVEATLGVKVIDRRDYKLSFSGNIAWNRNVLSKFSSPSGTVSEGKYVGYPLESIFGGKELGIDPYDGIYMYKLRPDAVVNEASDLKSLVNYRYYLGTSIAPITGGFTLRFSYKNLSCSVGGSYSFGAKINNQISSPVSYESVSGSYDAQEKPQTAYSDLYRNHLNVRKEMTDRWTKNNIDAKYPRIIDPFGNKLYLDQYNPTSSSVTLGSFLEDVSYLRIRDISLSYNLPKRWLTHVGVSSLGFSFMMSNFFTFTNYSGIDPETPGTTYPITRSIALGINIGF